MMRRFTLPLFALSCTVLAPPAWSQDLAAAIADAQANAPTLAEAQAGDAAASARMDRTMAEANPTVRLEGSAGIGRIDNGGFFGITADNVNPLAVQAIAEMPLYTGGRIDAARDQARGGTAIARYRIEQARLDVAISAVAAYAEVLTSRQVEQSFVSLVADLKELERQAALRFRAGEIASSDVAVVKARRAEAEAGLAAAHGRRMSAEAGFERLTGKAPGVLAPLPAPPPAPPSLSYAIELAHTNNPALKQAELGITIAQAGGRAARAEGMPSVGAFAEAAYVRDQFFPGYKSNTLAVGVRGRWTLFSGGRTAAQVRTADAEIAMAEARARQTRQTLDGMVIDAWHGLDTAQRMVTASEARLAAANEALRGTRLEAQVGAKPTLAVLDAQREVNAAQTALLEAQGRRHIAAWRLNALTGFEQ